MESYIFVKIENDRNVSILGTPDLVEKAMNQQLSVCVFDDYISDNATEEEKQIIKRDMKLFEQTIIKLKMEEIW